MFTIKATYRNETRRFTFPESVLFPTYEELHNQLYRIFPISSNYYLSRLIFSPDASKPGRILVGKEVHAAEDYDLHVAPLRRLWPNPLLRFTVLDDTPHKVQDRASQRSSLYSAATISPSEPIFKLPSPVVSRHDGILPLSPRPFIPPPPQPPAFVLSSPPPFNLSPPPPPPICCSRTTECSPRRLDTVGVTPCCSISRGKADVQVLLSSFKEDLERILTRTFGSDYTAKPSDSDIEGSTCTVSADIIPPQTGAPARLCFVCKINFTGVWYGCIKCPWHAVCPGCFSKSHSAHTLSFGPSHVVLQRSADCSSEVSTEISSEIKTRNDMLGTPHSPAHESSEPAGSPAPPVHRGVLCDSCDKVVVGIRHKCLDCPDYDLCSTCVESGATERHNPSHGFFDIKIPGRVYVHTVFSSMTDRSLGNPQQTSSSDQTTEGLIRHCATCNLCDSAIVGERYKCVACPDFDTCSSCFRITMEQHPSHGFVKVSKPEDLMMRDSISRRQITHLAACDSCGKTIRGVRYKCMHPGCPDFDLCTDCEALPIPVHPLNHPMLKLKTSEAVVPTVYKAGQTNAIDAPIGQEADPHCGALRSPVLLLPNALAIPTKSPEPSSAIVADHSANVTPQDQMPLAEEFLSPLGSPTSEILGAVPASAIAPSHLLVDVADSPGSPQSIHPPLDIYHQLWPKVNQEMIRLNAVEAREAEDPALNSIEDAITELVCRESPVAEESIPERVATPSSAYQTSQRHGISPVSSAPSAKSVVGGYCTPPSFTPSNHQEPHCVTRSCADDQQEIVTIDAPRQKCLDSVFLSDTNVPDGQIFPPGAEFVKGWRMMNNGELRWPTTTEVQFVAGETFAPEYNAFLRVKVGVVHPGQELDIWTGDLKAPDAPGRYVGYWRLTDGQGNFFGSSVWIDLTVADHHSDQSSEQSLAASSMVMPNAHLANSVNASDELQDAPHPSLPSTKTMTDGVEDPVSDISSVSLVSIPTSDDEDAEWQDTRTHSEPLEYVVLYGRNSEE